LAPQIGCADQYVTNDLDYTRGPLENSRSYRTCPLSGMDPELPRLTAPACLDFILPLNSTGRGGVNTPKCNKRLPHPGHLSRANPSRSHPSRLLVIGFGYVSVLRGIFSRFRASTRHRSRKALRSLPAVPIIAHLDLSALFRTTLLFSFLHRWQRLLTAVGCLARGFLFKRDWKTASPIGFCSLFSKPPCRPAWPAINRTRLWPLTP